MKIHEAIAMLEQMDQTKECTVTFGQPSVTHEYPGMPFQQQYIPTWVVEKPVYTGPYN